MPTLRYNKDKNNLEAIPGEELGMRYYCWEKDSSTGIYIASTEKLSKNVVYRQPLKTIYPTDRRISLLYSLLVSQIALTQEGYIYWETLKKNTDETGGIFAPQPSEMRGNLESITNTGEPVIGFISASTVTQKRIFVSNQQLRVYKNTTICPLDTLKRGDWGLAAESGANEVIEDLPQFGAASWVVARCANCVKAGGTKNKPSFWPNAHR